MDWVKLIETRHTTFAWQDTVPDKDLILEALKEVYQHIPSKNLMFPYQVRYSRAEEIFKLEEDERALDFRFIMGIGYAKDVKTRHTYFDPRTESNKNIPFSPIDVEIAYPRPNFDDVIKVIKE
jgi:hypothetical protein